MDSQRRSHQSICSMWWIQSRWMTSQGLKLARLSNTQLWVRTQKEDSKFSVATMNFSLFILYWMIVGQAAMYPLSPRSKWSEIRSRASSKSVDSFWSDLYVSALSMSLSSSRKNSRSLVARAVRLMKSLKSCHDRRLPKFLKSTALTSLKSTRINLPKSHVTVSVSIFSMSFWLRLW